MRNLAWIGAHFAILDATYGFTHFAGDHRGAGWGGEGEFGRTGGFYATAVAILRDPIWEYKDARKNTKLRGENRELRRF